MQIRSSTTNGFLIIWLTIAVLLLSLYDFYFERIGFPIFPPFGLLLLLFYLAVLSGNRLHLHYSKQYLSILVAASLATIAFASALWGQLYWGWIEIKGPAGFAAGAMALTTILLLERHNERLYRCLNAVLAVHFIFWLSQVVHFLIFGEWLDFIAPFTGILSRHEYFAYWSNIRIIRFTGLFAEPAAYSTFVYMGLAIRLFHNGFKFRLLDLLLILSIVITFSAYGFFLLSVLLGIYVLKRGPALKPVLLFCAVTAGIVALVRYSGEELLIGDFVRARLLSPFEDPSGNVRLMRGFEFIAELPDEARILGTGFGNYDTSMGVTNGVAYLLEYGGIFGSFAILLSFLTLGYVRKLSIPGYIALSATMLGTPLFTNLYWWFWIGNLILFGASTSQSRAIGNRGQ